MFACCIVQLAVYSTLQLPCSAPYLSPPDGCGLVLSCTVHSVCVCAQVEAALTLSRDEALQSGVQLQAAKMELRDARSQVCGC